MLPNFLIIGAQKGGTTWLRSMLRQHPDVFMPRAEVHYFNSKKNYPKGRAWYESHFRGVRGQTAVGEKTPGYLKVQPGHGHDTPEKIHALLPDVKMLAVLRNPVDRLLSGLNHHTVRGEFHPDTSIDTIIEKQIARDSRHLHYGYYARGLRAYYQLFDPAQIMVLIYEEDVLQQGQTTLTRVCDFLGIDPGFRFSQLKKPYNINSASYLSLRLAHQLRIPRGHPWRAFTISLDAVTRQPPYRPRPGASTLARLYDVYAPENEQLFALLGRRIQAWEKPSSAS